MQHNVPQYTTHAYSPIVLPLRDSYFSFFMFVRCIVDGASCLFSFSLPLCFRDRATPSSPLRSRARRRESVSFSSFSFRGRCMPRRENRSRRCAEPSFSSCSPYGPRPGAPPRPLLGSRNCFLSFYPVVLRAPLRYRTRPAIGFFRYSPVRYTCCQ